MRNHKNIPRIFITHYLIEKVPANEIRVMYLETKSQLGDLLTKPFGRVSFKELGFQIVVDTAKPLFQKSMKEGDKGM